MIWPTRAELRRAETHNSLISSELRPFEASPIDANCFHWPRLAEVFVLRWSGQDRRNHITGDVCQSIATTIVEVGELFVIDPQQMQHRRVQIVD